LLEESTTACERGARSRHPLNIEAHSEIIISPESALHVNMFNAVSLEPQLSGVCCRQPARNARHWQRVRIQFLLLSGADETRSGAMCRKA